jgi:hypothetical protein
VRKGIQSKRRKSIVPAAAAPVEAEVEVEKAPGGGGGGGSGGGGKRKGGGKTGGAKGGAKKAKRGGGAAGGKVKKDDGNLQEAEAPVFDPSQFEPTPVKLLVKSGRRFFAAELYLRPGNDSCVVLYPDPDDQRVVMEGLEGGYKWDRALRELTAEGESIKTKDISKTKAAASKSAESKKQKKKRKRAAVQGGDDGGAAAEAGDATRDVVDTRVEITAEMAAAVMNKSGKAGALEPFDFEGTAQEVSKRLTERGFVARWFKLEAGDDLFDPTRGLYELILVGINGTEVYRSGLTGSWDHEDHPLRTHKLFQGSEITKAQTFDHVNQVLCKGDCKMKNLLNVTPNGSDQKVR